MLRRRCRHHHTINLRRMTTSADTNSNVDIGETSSSQNQDRLKHLETQLLRLDKLERRSVDLDQSFSLFTVGNSGGGLFSTVRLNSLHVN